jgi:Zn-dependent peptidase ImmA (M78 family)
MTRRTTKLKFDPEFFKLSLKKREFTIERFSAEIKSKFPDAQLSVPTIHENMRDSLASRENLIFMAKFLGLSQKEFKILMGDKPLPVFFRRERMESVEEEAKDHIRELGNLYFSLRLYHTVRKALPSFANLTPEELSYEIKSFLKLPQTKISFDEVVNALEEFGVHVHFYPFSFLGFEKSKTKNYRSASIQKDGCWLILLDTSNTLHDSLFDLFHELAHIFAGHNLNDQSKEIEVYCNTVAAEILTPTRFFVKNADYLNSVMKTPSVKLIGEVGLIQDVLGASFEGIVLALSRNNILSLEAKRYLFACIHKRKQENLSVGRLLNIENAESEEWAKTLASEEASEYLAFFKKFKSAYLANKVTTRVVSSVFGLPVEEGDNLCRIWAEELNVSQEEVDSIRDDETCQDF